MKELVEVIAKGIVATTEAVVVTEKTVGSNIRTEHTGAHHGKG